MNGVLQFGDPAEGSPLIAFYENKIIAIAVL